LRAGFLLWGPPGCGKTYIARALAGELGLFFVHVGIADVLDIWTGSSERNIRQVFEHARAMAPTLLFIDELDALGHRRAGLRHNVGARNVVNQLLIELDGAATENEGLLILGATNQPWDVDSALLRPGRFDEQLIVLPPDAAARRAILERGFDAVPTDRLDLDPVVQRTEVYSGADLASICSRAAQSAMTRSVAAGHVQPVTQQDLMAATAAVAPSTDNWLRSAENFIEFSNDSRYDVLARYLAKLKRRR
jgi:SpoVK/Ycf46/Vps4 family AAA+-type ATPase